MAKKTIKTYSDGATCRLKNKRISFSQKNNAVIIQFAFADENPELPACEHKTVKGKVRVTTIKMTDEALEALIYTWKCYKNNLIQHNANNN